MKVRESAKQDFRRYSGAFAGVCQPRARDTVRFAFCGGEIELGEASGTVVRWDGPTQLL